jgi:iron(III) transport system substrate-binding protein
MLVPALSLLGLGCAAIGACKPATDNVVVYCSVDEAFARRVLGVFTERTGIKVDAVFDSEAGKTTGLVNRIRAERNRPRADVLFSSELFNTMKLADEGLLAKYSPPAAADIPSRYRDPANQWTAIGLRGRVLAFDPSRTPRDDLPDTWEELAEQKWASRLAMANPLFGTTRGHNAAMFALWGERRATEFLKRISQHGTLIVGGNSSALRAVIDKRADWCMTDTDDVWVAQRDGASVDLKYLDMGDGGTLWIPCSVALVKGAEDSPNAQRLVDFLVSDAAERLLAESASRNVPVRPALRESLSLDEPPMSKLSYRKIADVLDSAAISARDILLK